MRMTKSHSIIAITGTTGAGKVEVGRRVAARLGCNYLDKERLMAAAELIGDSQPSLEQVQEATRVVLLGSGGHREERSDHERGEPFLLLSVDDLVYLPAQLALLRASASQGPLVVVGRAARWILANEPNLISVYLHAPLEFRAQRICKFHSIASEAVGEQLAMYCDERRTNFIRRVAGPKPQDQDSYHLCVDTSRVGIGQTAEIVLSATSESQREVQEADRNSVRVCPCPVP